MLMSIIRFSLEIDLVNIARTSAAVAGAPRLSNGVARRPSQDITTVCLDYVSTTSVFDEVLESYPLK
jgi:hypothetical protein